MMSLWVWIWTGDVGGMVNSDILRENNDLSILVILGIFNGWKRLIGGKKFCDLNSEEISRDFG